MDNCIFCKIVRDEIPSVRVYEDEHTIALLTIAPTAPMHTLVIPKVHDDNLLTISKEDYAHVQETVRKIAPAILKASGADGFNILQNNLKAAGQLVDHLHVHIIPRTHTDGLAHWTHSPADVDTRKEWRDKIIAQL